MHFKKVYLYLIILTTLIVFTLLPLFTEANMTSAEKLAIKQSLPWLNSTITFTDIYANNFFIATLTLIPIAGNAFLLRVMYDTGRVLMALDANPILLFLNPIFWLEYGVYAYSFTTSILLFKDLFDYFSGTSKQDKMTLLRVWFKRAHYVIARIAIVLLFSAVLEVII